MTSKIVFNGQEYDGVGSMPPAAAPSSQPAAMPSPPPAIDAADSRRGQMVRIALWVAVGLAVLIWLLVRH